MSETRKPLTGEAYFQFLERVAARVSKWPAWKQGIAMSDKAKPKPDVKVQP